MPVGIDFRGFPIGADLIARSNDDRKLLAIAKAVRKQFKKIPPPSI